MVVSMDIRNLILKNLDIGNTRWFTITSSAAKDVEIWLIHKNWVMLKSRSILEAEERSDPWNKRPQFIIYPVVVDDSISWEVGILLVIERQFIHQKIGAIY